MYQSVYIVVDSVSSIHRQMVGCRVYVLLSSISGIKIQQFSPLNERSAEFRFLFLSVSEEEPG
jgi:hypothetical protein